MARGTTSTTANNPISPPLPALPPPTPISKQGQVFAGGPAYPSNWQATATGGDRGRTAQHSRRPSRAERYEVLVESARELLRRAENKGHVGLGIDSEQRAAVDPEEWRDTVGNLLKVVDGMVRQLATHDELAAQLKIAQSNLTLAETHSEFLEETLRRRDSRSSASMVSRHSASGAPAPPTGPGRRATTEGDRPESSTSLFGLGLEDSRSSAASFFRMPSKRKQTPSVVSTASSVSLPPPTTLHTLRSSSSSPRLGDHPRNSHDTTFSEDHPAFENGAGKTVSQLTGELFALQAQVTSLEQTCTTLKSTNTSLRRSAEAMAGRCAELEKTKDDLMAELENLSMELFQEANTMVADERKKSAKSEEEVTRLRTEIEALSRDLELLRRGISGPHDDDRRHSGASSKTMLPRRPPNSTMPTLSPPDPSAFNSPSLAPITTSTSPNISQSGSPDRDNVSLASATSSRKWFNFGRSSSIKSRSGSERDDSGASPNPNGGGVDGDGGMLQPPQAPGMLRAGSVGSLRSISSVSSSFFSAMSADDKAEREKEMRDGDAESGERQELLDQKDRDAEEDDVEQDPTTPMVSSNARGRIPSLPQASLYPLPPSPNLSHPPPPALSVQLTSPPPPARPSPPPPINTSSLSPRMAPTSGFSTDSSTPSSSGIPFPSSTSPNPSSSRSPRLDLARGARPVAIHSFEGEAIAKSPKSPNAARWAELAGAIPSPSTSSFAAASTSSPPLAGAQPKSEERSRSLSATGRSSTESSRPRSPLLPSNERDKERHEPPRNPHRPPPLKLDPTATAPLAPRPSPPLPPRATPPPPSSSSSTTSPAPTASALPPTLSRSSSERTNASASPTTTTFPLGQRPKFIRSSSSVSSSRAQPLPSPTFSLPPSASGLISTSTSLSSLRSPGGAVDDLEGLMRNIEDMNRSLFGDDDDDDEAEMAEEGVAGEVEREEQEPKRRE